MGNVEKYLNEFSLNADNWFASIPWLSERYNFFKKFFSAEYLSKAEWKDFQEMGDNLHCFNSLAIAKRNALGNPNHSIEHYRNSFEYLVRGSDPLDVRLDNLKTPSSEYFLKYFGVAALGELIGYALPDKYVIRNRRDIEALNYLDHPPSYNRGDSFGKRYVKYNDGLVELKELYSTKVGKKTTTTLPLELDQFFSWLYENHVKPFQSQLEIFPIIEKFLNQSQTDNLQKKGYPIKYKDFDLKVSFGVGNNAKVPWIAFLKEPHTVTNGIYPVYLYYKEDNLLILAYGVSVTDSPTFKWLNENNLTSIKKWFLDNRNKVPIRYGDSYIKSVYELPDDLDSEIIQKELDELLIEYQKIPLEENNKSEWSEPDMVYTKRYWLIAPGEGAYLWDEFYEKGIIGIGWDRMGDLSRFNSREEIQEEMIRMYPERTTNHINNSLCLWQFSHEMKPGDIVITKKGISEYIGYGIVESNYYYDESRVEDKNLRKVDWKKKGRWEETVHKIVLKTLTDITKYPEYVDRLKRLIGIEQEASIDTNKIQYYWLNANPKYWKIDDFQVGDEQSYTTHNENGNKRNRFEYFQSIKPGDLVIGYETTPTKKVLAIFEVTKSAHIDDDDGMEKISFVIQKFLPEPISYETLKSMPELSNSEVMRNNQGSLFKLSKNEFDAIVNKELSLEADVSSYTFDQAEKEIFLDRQDLQNILDTLIYKKNIILQGPPGVGKTFMAKRLAFLMMENKDNTKVEMIQFHQSYSYEDFIQGYRPKEGGGFKLENGVFYRFCKRAQADPDSDYFFIIDEINRGNLSKIFGELMLLIEADKRGKENAVVLTYSGSNENRFYIPNNVFLIGTMNTADRSLGIIDYALRRRFAFLTVPPSFNDKLKGYLLNKGVDEGIIQKINEKISQLNDEICKDLNLGKGFQIGHSYFCNVPAGSGGSEWYINILRHEIAPLLEEYWFDKEDKYKSEIEKLIKG